jgi:hypothetical protein
VKQNLIKMEKQISLIPLLQKSKEKNVPTVKNENSCCSTPVNESACCTPSKNKEENNGHCCAQPTDGSACCDK